MAADSTAVGAVRCLMSAFAGLSACRTRELLFRGLSLRAVKSASFPFPAHQGSNVNAQLSEAARLKKEAEKERKKKREKAKKVHFADFSDRSIHEQDALCGIMCQCSIALYLWRGGLIFLSTTGDHRRGERLHLKTRRRRRILMQRMHR